MINSTQHSMRRSRASLENDCPEDGGRISVMIFWTVAALVRLDSIAAGIAKISHRFILEDGRREE